MASNPLKPSIHPISRDPGENWNSKFQALSCYKELRSKLADGVPIPEVRRWLQEEMKEYIEVTPDSMTRMLYRFRQRIPVAERKAITPAVTRELLDKQRAEIKLRVEPIQELEKLYLQQMERIGIDTQHEKDIGKLFGSTSNEMRLAMDILVKLQGLHTALREATGGGAPRVGQEPQVGVAITSTHYESPGVQKVLGNKESQRRVLNVAQTMFAFVNGKGAPVEALRTLLQQGGNVAAGTGSGKGASEVIDVDVDDVDDGTDPFPIEEAESE